MREKFFFLLSITTPLIFVGMTPAQIAQERQANQSKVINTTVSEVLNGGKVIEMKDGSRWQINPKDVDKTGGWLGPAEVRISPNPSLSSQYRYRIRNSWTGTTVTANKIEEPQED